MISNETVDNLAATRRRPRGTSLQRERRLWGWIFLSPWVIGFVVFTAAPIIASLVFSFTNFNLVNRDATAFIGLGNFKRLFTDPVLKVSLGVTFKFFVLALPLSIILPVLLAALLNSRYLAGKRLFRTLFYMPYVVPVVSAIFIWGGVLNSDSGWLNRALRLVGIPGPNWLDDVNWIFPALLIIGLWGLGNAYLITLASMQAVPTVYYEPARVDRIVDVTQEDAERETRRLSREEGVSVGVSSGGAVWAARRVCEELDARGEDGLNLLQHAIIYGLAVCKQINAVIAVNHHIHRDVGHHGK